MVVKSSRVTSVANDEARAIEMHATLSATDEQMGALTHRGSAVDVWRCESGRAVGWTGVNLQAVASTSESGKKCSSA